MFHNLNFLQILWLIIGFSGQALFGARMLFQWLHSEKQRRSSVPLIFWWFSIIGGFCLLLYSIHLRDPVIISGQLFGVVIYARNLWLIYGERKTKIQSSLSPLYNE